MEPNLPYPEILFSCDCNLGVLYTHSPYLGVRGKFFLDVCLPIVLWTHGIGLTIVSSHGISPMKESIVTQLCMVLFCIRRETVRARRGSAAVLLQGVSLHLSGL